MGEEAYNLTLSDWRARTGKTYLMADYGIGAGHLIEVGMGEQ